MSKFKIHEPMQRNNKKNPPSCGDPQPSYEEDKIDFQLVTSVNVVVHRGREFGLTFLPFGLQKRYKSLDPPRGISGANPDADKVPLSEEKNIYFDRIWRSRFFAPLGS